MVAPLDIFREEPDGSLVWVASADSFEAAKTKIKEKTAGRPAENYVVMSLTTLHKLLIKPEELD